MKNKRKRTTKSSVKNRIACFRKGILEFNPTMKENKRWDSKAK